MKTLSRIRRFRLGNEPIDAPLSQWGCILGGLGIGSLAIVTLRQYAASQMEFLLAWIPMDLKSPKEMAGIQPGTQL